MMYAEDFCFYARRIPSCFLNLGTRNEEKGFVEKNHSPRFDLDEAALSAGVKLLCALAANVS
jgi:metal-dependent amidase/aminoacylase/carboxypeptidase family protein